jgi:hypothetical protein
MSFLHSLGRLPDTINLPDINLGQVVILALVVNQDVNAGLGEIGTLPDFGPFAAREHDPEPGPVHAVDDAHALGEQP